MSIYSTYLEGQTDRAFRESRDIADLFVTHFERKDHISVHPSALAERHWELSLFNRDDDDDSFYVGGVGLTCIINDSTGVRNAVQLAGLYPIIASHFCEEVPNMGYRLKSRFVSLFKEFQRAQNIQIEEVPAWFVPTGALDPIVGRSFSGYIKDTSKDEIPLNRAKMKTLLMGMMPPEPSFPRNARRDLDLILPDAPPSFAEYKRAPHPPPPPPSPARPPAGPTSIPKYFPSFRLPSSMEEARARWMDASQVDPVRFSPFPMGEAAFRAYYNSSDRKVEFDPEEREDAPKAELLSKLTSLQPLPAPALDTKTEWTPATSVPVDSKMQLAPLSTAFLQWTQKHPTATLKFERAVELVKGLADPANVTERAFLMFWQNRT
jgi:hypothetical protein